MSLEKDVLKVCPLVINCYETVIRSNEPEASQLAVKLLEAYTFAVRQTHKSAVAAAKAKRGVAPK